MSVLFSKKQGNIPEGEGIARAELMLNKCTFLWWNVSNHLQCKHIKSIATCNFVS